MTAPYEGDVHRDFVEHTNDSGGRVQAHKVTAETEGTVTEAVTGNRRDVKAGDVLVQSNHPDQFWVVSGKDFEGYTESHKSINAKDSSPEAKDSSPEASEAFDPSKKNAAEVRAYLNSVREDRAEYERVVEAERSGQNRSSAFPSI